MMRRNKSTVVSSSAFLTASSDPPSSTTSSPTNHLATDIPYEYSVRSNQMQKVSSSTYNPHSASASSPSTSLASSSSPPATAAALPSASPPPSTVGSSSCSPVCCSCMSLPSRNVADRPHSGPTNCTLKPAATRCSVLDTSVASSNFSAELRATTSSGSNVTPSLTFGAYLTRKSSGSSMTSNIRGS